MMVEDDTTTYYYAHDHLYSPVALINSSGTVVERYEYNAYGTVQIMDAIYTTRSSSSYNNVIAFTGQRLDALDSSDLEIMYYKNRYYHPDMGRFVNRDPISDSSFVYMNKYFQENKMIEYYLEMENLFGYNDTNIILEIIDEIRSGNIYSSLLVYIDGMNMHEYVNDLTFAVFA